MNRIEFPSIVTAPPDPHADLRDAVMLSVESADLHTLRRLHAVLHPPRPPCPIDTPAKAVAALRPFLDGHTVEVLAVIVMDSTLSPLHIELVSRGSPRATVVDPATILRLVLAFPTGTCAVLAHNHPSGDATPSPEDRRATDRVSDAFATLGLRLLDHVILSPTGHASMAELGLLKHPPNGHQSTLYL